MLKSRGLEVYDAFAMAVAIDPSVAELAVEAEVTLLPTGQLLCVCDDPAAKSHTPAEFYPADGGAKKKTTDEPKPEPVGDWSVTRRMSKYRNVYATPKQGDHLLFSGVFVSVVARWVAGVLEDIKYERFCEVYGNEEFCIKNEECAFKTRSFVLKMMNFAGVLRCAGRPGHSHPAPRTTNTGRSEGRRTVSIRPVN